MIKVGGVPLSDLVYYDSTSPSGLRWKVARYAGKDHKQLRRPVGSVAGSRRKGDDYYYQLNFTDKSFKVHRLIMELHGHDVEGMEVDHIDGDRGNNVLSNLRIVTRSSNMRNSGISSRNTSGVTGVSYTSFLYKGVRYERYNSTWYDIQGRKKAKNFPLIRYGGREAAFEAACLHRQQIIEELNLQGAGYSERHGT